jgi:hypothetical protein
MSADPLVDFEAVVLTLRRHGWTYRSIAESIDVGESTVKGYVYHAARPPYDVGERLVNLWVGVTRSTRDQLPKLRFSFAR